MPLSKERMRLLSAARRNGDKPTTNLNTAPVVKPNLSPIHANPFIANPLAVPPLIPSYDPRIHRCGDVVRINGKVVTIPELDADGAPIW